MTVEILPPSKICSPQQRKFLNQRLARTHAPTLSTYWRDNAVDKKMPPEVRKAKRIVQEWEKKERRANERINSALDAALDNTKSAILFKSPEEALARVEAYEQLVADVRRKYK